MCKMQDKNVQSARSRCTKCKRGLFVGLGGNFNINERLILSFLAYRLNKARGDYEKSSASIRMIASGCCLCPGRTVPLTLKGLTACGLVAELNGRFWITEKLKVNNFKSANRPNLLWYSSFAYLSIKLPSKIGLTTRQNLVYWQIASAHKRMNMAYISQRLGIDRRTVSSAVRTLRDLGLVDPTRLVALPLQESHLELWQDKKNLKPEQSAKQSAEAPTIASNASEPAASDLSNTPAPAPSPKPKSWRLAEQWEQFTDRRGFLDVPNRVKKLDAIQTTMESKRFTRKQIVDVWKNVLDQIGESRSKDEKKDEIMDSLICEFQEIIVSLARHTEENRAKGAFSGPNCAGAIKLAVQSGIKIMEQQANNTLLFSANMVT